VRLLSLKHRVYAIWKRDRADDTPLRKKEWTGAERLVLYKREGNPIFARELAAPEHAALAAWPRAARSAGRAGLRRRLDAAAAQALFAFVAKPGSSRRSRDLRSRDLGGRARRPAVPLRAVAHPRRARRRGPDSGHLITAFQARDKFQGASSELTWMIGILRNKIFEHLRRQSREVPLDVSEEGEEREDGSFDGTGHWSSAAAPADWGGEPHRRPPKARSSPRR
jgi:hypothetical protein